MKSASPPPAPHSKNAPITHGSLSSELVFLIERRVWDNLQYPDGNMASPHNTGLDTDPQSLSVASGCSNPFILSRHQLQNLNPRCQSGAGGLSTLVRLQGLREPVLPHDAVP